MIKKYGIYINAPILQDILEPNETSLLNLLFFQEKGTFNAVGPILKKWFPELRRLGLETDLVRGVIGMVS